MIADGERGILIGPRGEFVWMCMPRWDSDAIFSALIGGEGVYAITPVNRFVWGGHYESGSLIWRERSITQGSIIECRSAMAFPGDPHRAIVLRRLIAASSDAHVTVLLDPRPSFGAESLRRLHRDDRGVWTGEAGSLHVRWQGAGAAQVVRAPHRGPRLAMESIVPAGQHHDFVLELSDAALPDELPDPGREWRGVEEAWHRAMPDFSGVISPGEAQHSYAVLRGLTSSGGGMVAATTMSLPERAAEGRNYDYRYVWIRDQCFTGEAVAAAGPHPLLDDAVRFVAGCLLAHGPDMKPAYTSTGGAIPDQRSLDLGGYPGGFDIIGNHVNKQFQLDGFGEALLLLAAAARHDHLDADGWRAAEIAADAIGRHWQHPDAGIWELDPRYWTHSRLIGVAGLRAMSAAGAPATRVREWLALAEAMLHKTTATSLHPSGRWQRATDDERVDAALLFPPIRGALRAHDPRTLATMRAIEQDLGQNGFVYRFRQSEGPLSDAEGAFLLCGFAMALAAHQQGHDVDATRWFERSRNACGPPGLYTEEFDVIERQLRGNAPQAFVHAVMLECCVRLARPWHDEY
jgi:hypothetical protein